MFSFRQVAAGIFVAAVVTGSFVKELHMMGLHSTKISRAMANNENNIIVADISSAATTSSSRSEDSSSSSSSSSPSIRKANNNDNNNIVPTPRMLWLKTKDVLILHLGKAAGQSLNQRLRKHWRLFIEQCHPTPCHNIWQKQQQGGKNPPPRDLLVTLRDPVERFVSAFYWRAYMTGHPDPARRVTSCPPRGCQARGHRREAKTLFVKYNLSASALAEELCSQNATVQQEARASLQTIQHARYSVEDWLSFDWQAHADSLFPLVVERGIESFENQTDRAVHWLHQRRGFEKPQSFLRRARYLNSLNLTKSGKGNLHSSASLKRSLSPRAEQCLVQFYRKDYQLLGQIRELACKTTACRQGIDSILARRASLLKQQAPRHSAPLHASYL